MKLPLNYYPQLLPTNTIPSGDGWISTGITRNIVFTPSGTETFDAWDILSQQVSFAGKSTVSGYSLYSGSAKRAETASSADFASRCYNASSAAIASNANFASTANYASYCNAASSASKAYQVNVQVPTPVPTSDFYICFASTPDGSNNIWTMSLADLKAALNTIT